MNQGGFLRRAQNRLSGIRYEPTVLVAFLLTIILTYLVIAPIGSMILDTVKVSLKDSATTGLPRNSYTLFFITRTFASRVSQVLFWTPLFRTLLVSACVALIAIPLGALMAWLTIRTDLPGRKFVSSIMVIPYMLPSWTFAVAWLNLLKNRRMGGAPGILENLGITPPNWLAYGAVPIIVCEALHLFPFAFLLFGNALRSVDIQLEESARILGAPRRTITKRIILPLLKPALMSALLLTVSRVLGSFGTPYILGSVVKFHLLPTALYNSFKVGSPGVAAVIATVTILIGILLVAVDTWFVREFKRYVTIGGKGAMKRGSPLGKLKIPATVFAIAVVAIAIIVPLGSIVLSSVTKQAGVVKPDNFTLAFWIGKEIPAHPGQNGIIFNKEILNAAWNSLRIAGFAALIAGLSGLMVGYIVVKLPNTRIANYLRQVSFLPYLVPSIGFAAACLSFFAVRRGPIPSLYGTIFLLILVMSMKYLPFAARSGIAAMMQVGNEPEEAARICGATWFKRIRRIVVPIQKHALLTGIVLPFITGMKEQSLVIMLASPGTEVLTTQILRYIEYGYTQLANATMLTIVILIFVLTFGLEKITGGNLASGFGGRN
jgi:iron(III) transport system permease protein